MIEIIAKAATLDAVMDKQLKGADAIEWQLISSGNTEVDLNKLEIPIYNVHSRLIVGDDVCLDACLQDKLGITGNNNYKYLIEALELANKIGKFYNRNINIVTHLNYGETVQSSETWKNFLESLFDKYEYCNILVENSTAFIKTRLFRNMSNPETVPNFVKFLIDSVDDKYKNRLGSVLDICHVLGSIRIMNDIYIKSDLSEGYVDELKELEKYFKEYSTTCKTVHFNYINKYGVNARDHGVDFDSQETFDKIFKLYLSYVKGVNLVVEVREDDLLNGLNFESVAKKIREAEKKITLV